MEKPYEYFENNVYGLLCLLDVMRNNGVNIIIFSSSAAVYGEPERVPICEEDKASPFGRKALFVLLLFEIKHMDNRFFYRMKNEIEGMRNYKRIMKI